MVAGYPGRTDRYRLADELQSATEWLYPALIATFGQQLAVIDAAGRTNPDVAVE